MYSIRKITSDHVVDFAAEELKKYLRMMMPRSGEIDVSYAPDAKDGFRLGLMTDFGLDTSEADDVELDDILHIDCDMYGGIIAGSNPRSVLLAVYRYLTMNGCFFLFPGVDGEMIPIKNVEPIYYHKMADMRYRGQCNEGAESQQSMLDTIDFAPKLGMNVYMLEFDIPKTYYDGYYTHEWNTENREPEPVSENTVLQWKRACEVEISKRGLQFHDMGHGWNTEAFGISTAAGWRVDESNSVTDEVRQYLALVDGERGLYKGVALNTNFCMSNEKARGIVAKCVADYADRARGVDYLHVWLADWQRNHCECDECRKMIPSDWYVMLLNDIDDELSSRGLNTRIVFIQYSDTSWAPEKIKLKNPARFSMLTAAISRSYTYSVEKDPDVPKTQYVRNVTGRLDSLEEYLVHTRDWRKMTNCPSIVYEYHFWKHQFYAPGILSFARRIFEDIESYRLNGFDGIIEDGSQRSFFPSGFLWYVYASKLFDLSCDFDMLTKNYFSHAYGGVWEKVLRGFMMLDKHMPESYIEQKHSVDNLKNKIDRSVAELLSSVDEICDELDSVIEAHKNMPMRAGTVSMRLLSRYTEYCRGLARALILRAQGEDDEAKRSFDAFASKFGKYEAELDRYYDHRLMRISMKYLFTGKIDVLQ